MAIVKRWPLSIGFKQESMYGFFSAEAKKCGRCREVAVVERWPLAAVRVYKGSFRRNDFWDKLVGKALVMIGRWYSRQPSTNHR